MDTVNVCFYMNGGLDTVNNQYNTAEINAIFLCGKVTMDKQEYNIKYTTFDVDEQELGINLEEKQI
ncbi:hypothetical protein K2F43_00810 [Clostridium estertheticum]|uniref:hypothetical protein n=1 Tax=Clostridium estertheticum TaxID=238834 RepID=UPI001C6EC3B5|nr:hypothetical protein [Clostridium estertheticum]MBW9169741.1 hypothetical protein [Clostridium estertheticum]WLC74752.1 hypothetical protein KTC99_18655 [Clostridium estertheticum]